MEAQKSRMLRGFETVAPVCAAMNRNQVIYITVPGSVLPSLPLGVLTLSDDVRTQSVEFEGGGIDSFAVLSVVDSSLCSCESLVAAAVVT